MFIKREQLLACKDKLTQTPYREFYGDLLELCESMKAGLPPTVNNLFRARAFSRFAISLAGMYVLTDDASYAEAAWRITAENFDRPRWDSEGTAENPIDLSVGEMAFALSAVKELLGDWIDAGKQALLQKAAVRYVFEPYLRAVEGAEKAWWYRTHINWNPVVNGGVYCLALCYANVEEMVGRILPLALFGMEAYTDGMHMDGSCEEGVGYWLYGMMFQTYAMLAYENVTGEKAAFFAHPAAVEGLSFPFDFSPYGAGISFGDVNWFWPSGGVYAMAARANRTDIAQKLSQRLLLARETFAAEKLFKPETCFMRVSELFGLAFCTVPYDEAAAGAVRQGLKVYPDNGWGLFGCGDMHLSFRSGNSAVNHGSRNLNSIQLSKNGVTLLRDCANHPYPDGWFGEGRQHFIEDMALSKSTMLVNGVGQMKHGEADWGYDEIEMYSDITAILPDVCRKVRRSVSLENDGFFVRDEFVTKEGKERVWHEIRFVSYGGFTDLGAGRWALEAEGERVVLSITADVPLVFDVIQIPASIGVRPSACALRCVTEEASMHTVIQTLIRAE